MKMTKIDLMKIVLKSTKHFYDVSTDRALEAVARKQATYYTKAQLQAMVDNLDNVSFGIKIH